MWSWVEPVAVFSALPQRRTLRRAPGSPPVRALMAGLPVWAVAKSEKGRSTTSGLQGKSKTLQQQCKSS